MPRLSPYFSRHSATILVFLVSAAWASVILLTGHHYRHSPGAEESLIARHLARGEGFSSPMDESARAEPTSWSPPVYPYIEATAFRLFGIDTLHATLLLATMNAISFGIVATCAYHIASIAILKPRIPSPESPVPNLARSAGITAVILLCAHPILMRFVYDYWDGEVSLAIFMLALALGAAWGTQALGAKHAAILGALLGLLSLTNAAYVFAYPLIVLFAARGTIARQKLAMIAVTFLMFIVTLLPWTARNYKEFGRPIYVRGGASLELWNGNRAESSGWLSPRTMVNHPFRNDAERALLLRLGEVQYFDLCSQRFRDEIKSDPRHFLALTGKRIIWLFLGDPGTRGWIPFPMRWGIFDFDIEHLILLITTILGAIAPVVVHRCHPERYAAKDPVPHPKPGASRNTAQHDSSRSVALYLIAIAILAVLPFFITSSADRYALPLRTLLCILSAITLISLLHSRTTSASGFPIQPTVA
jgi:hypothetical protein